MTNTQKTHLYQGNKAFREKKYDLALDFYNKALEASPELEKIISANIGFTKRKLTDGLQPSNRDYSNRIIKLAAEKAEQQPDFFAIRSALAEADLLVCSWIESQSDLIKTLQISNKIQSAFETVILAPRDLLDSIVISTLPINCKSLQIIFFPQKTRKNGSFIRTLNAGIFTKYSDMIWIEPSDGIAFDTDQIETFIREQRTDVGIVANSLTTSGNVKSSFRDQNLGSWLARLHRVNKNLAAPVPQGSFCVRTLILNQLCAMGIKPTKFDSITPIAESEAFETIRTAIGITANEGLFRVLNSKERMLSDPSSTQVTMNRTVKTIAFYLPQFHRIPENDLWWGKGFTEWNNVIRAKPLFRSHYQPKLPADLGFYDLSAESTQVAQAKLAESFGIHGFCYYYYWFNGKKLLNQPIENMLNSGKPDFPFCVCWANENWSRNWDGQNKHVLMEQKYSKESNLDLIHEFIKMMKDPRYITHNGKPVLLVYRIKIIPNWLQTAQMWREECRKAGLGEIHLCSIRFGLEPLEGMPDQHGLDSYVMFPPQDMRFVDAKSTVQDLNSDFGGTMYSYDEVVDADISRFRPGYQWPVHRGAMLGWDNTARRLTSARVFVGCTPMRYRSWIKQILEQEDRHNPNNESLLFINAWNEWAEGTTLEPDQKYGTAYLEATKSVLGGYYEMKGSSKETVSAPDKEPSRQIRYIKPISNAKLPDYWHGELSINPNQPTILVCAHISGHHLFGGERSFLDVIKTLKKLNFNIIVSLPSSNNKDYIEMIGEHVHATYSFPYTQWTSNREPDSRVTMQFADIIAKHNVCVVYSNTIVLVEPAAAARKMGRISITHIRELITLDDSLRERIGLPIQEIIKSVFERYDFAIANSKATESVFARAGRTFYAPNAVDHKEISTPNIVGEKIRFGIVSSNIPKKGISDFIKVAVICKDLINEAEFVVIGPENAYTAVWKDAIGNGQLPENIKFLGYRESPKQAMAEINVLLNLSLFAESFGRTVAEAMSAKRPVIAYEWGALSELVQHDKNGYLVPFGDVKSVSDHVRKFVSDRSLISKLGNGGFKYITGHFSHDVLYNKLSSAFSSIKKSAEWKSIISGGYSKSQTNNTTVIIPVYNAFEEVKNCLDSVLLHTPRDVDVIVLDDGSTDHNISKLLAGYHGKGSIKVLTNEQNIGYTKTVNRGITEAGSNDVILLNSDTIVTPYWLQSLRASAYAAPKIGTVTAMSDNAGAFSFPKQGKHNPKPEYLSHDEYAAYLIDKTFNCAFVEVPTGSGFCFYIRRSLLDQIGGFDEVLFPRGYGEENDFCMRADVSGWKNVISPWVFIYHVRTASFKGEKDTLVKSGVDIVTKKFPEYAARVKTAFNSENMANLRKFSDIFIDVVDNDNNI
ncbi:glycoside hydrolase family 99-like domain-containing protein [Pseudomonas veronii]|uniref:glycoside hydrolase family 99-like domain-containing protein n=1 Tax=Pseudomonas veronii TaxID=76761 RepID=UPI0009E5B7BA|nr:glycoside hydrolase family 99-like domain-containing protein [Pseudomonas veronii]